MPLQSEISVRRAVDSCCRLPFLRHTPLKELYRLARHMSEVAFEPGEVLLRQVRGDVRLVVWSKGLAVVHPHLCLSEVAFAPGEALLRQARAGGQQCARTFVCVLACTRRLRECTVWVCVLAWGVRVRKGGNVPTAARVGVHARPRPYEYNTRRARAHTSHALQPPSSRAAAWGPMGPAGGVRTACCAFRHQSFG